MNLPLVVCPRGECDLCDGERAVIRMGRAWAVLMALGFVVNVVCLVIQEMP